VHEADGAFGRPRVVGLLRPRCERPRRPQPSPAWNPAPAAFAAWARLLQVSGGRRVGIRPLRAVADPSSMVRQRKVAGG
jgi:hypothetical protein